MTTLAEMFVKIGADLTDFEKKMKRMQKDLSNMGQSMKDIGENLSAGLTVPLTALGAIAGKTAMDVDSAQGKIQASLGITAEQAKKLGDIAQGVWKKGFGEGIDEVSDGLVTIQQNMGDLADGELDKLTEAAFTLKEAFGAEVTESTRTAAVMMKQFGISGMEAMDLITVGFQKGGDFSGELLDTLREYAPQFQAMGMSAEQSMAMLLAGTEAGAFNLDKIGDAAKEFNIRMKDGSDTSSEALKALGFNVADITTKFAQGGETGTKAMQAVMLAIANIKDPLKQNQLGVALFGTQWEDLESQVIEAMATSNLELGNFEGSTSKAGKALHDNFGDRATALWRDFTTALKPVGDVLLSLAEEWMPKVSAAIKTLADWFNGLSPTMQKVVVIIGVIVAAIGPLLVILGSLAGAVSALMPVFISVGGVIAGISAPVAIAVAVIAGLVAAGIYLYKNWDTVKAKFQAITSAIWDTIKIKFNSVVSYLKGLGTTFFNAGKWLIEQMKQGIQNAASSVLSAVKSIAGKIRDYLPFSPAKTGPLSDLDHLDFGGPITDSIQRAMPNVKGMMNDLLTMPTIKGTVNAETQQPNVYNFDRLFEGANIQVRNESDIKKIARELHSLINQTGRGRGVMI